MESSLCEDFWLLEGKHDWGKNVFYNLVTPKFVEQLSLLSTTGLDEHVRTDTI